jgi:hypothetical protein
VDFIEVALETEAAVYLGWHVIVAHLLTQCSGECGGHLRTSQVLAGDADGLADELMTLLENAVSALADVLSCEAL